jgi:hypothetical protein
MNVSFSIGRLTCRKKPILTHTPKTFFLPFIRFPTGIIQTFHLHCRAFVGNAIEHYLNSLENQIGTSHVANATLLMLPIRTEWKEGERERERERDEKSWFGSATSSHTESSSFGTVASTHLLSSAFVVLSGYETSIAFLTILASTIANRGKGHRCERWQP